jgi:oligoendopeptidase F
MRNSSDAPMPTFTDLKNGKFLFAYDRETVIIEGKEQYQFDSVETDRPERDAAISALIALKYSIADEIALINNRLSGGATELAEYETYRQFREEVKNKVDLSIANG